MIEIDNAKDELIAKVSIIGYGEKTKHDCCYFEVAEVDNNGNTYNHMPLTKKTMSKLSIIQNGLNVIDCKKRFDKSIKVLKLGQTLNGPVVEFYHGPRIFNIRSTTDSIPSGSYMFPSIYYHYKNSELKILAMSNNSFNKNTKLHYLPFHNTYSDGRRCTGNNNLDALNDMSDYNEIIEKIIAISWYSTFNNHLANDEQFFNMPLKDIYNTYSISNQKKHKRYMTFLNLCKQI